MSIGKPGIQDIHGNEVFFILFEADLLVNSITFHRVYVRDCSDGGRHPLSLNGFSENIVRDFLLKKEISRGNIFIQ
jgi:hypothetical protein